MVKYIFISMILLVTFVGCSSINVQQDYPSHHGTKMKQVVSSNKSKSYEDVLKNSHPVDEVYDWPIRNAPQLLQNTKEGSIVSAKSKNGEEVLFAVLSEYPSAGKKLCKKYFVNLDLHLACFNPHWYPVRSFEE